MPVIGNLCLLYFLISLAYRFINFIDIFNIFQIFIYFPDILLLISNTGIPHFIVLCRYYVSYKLKVCGNAVWSKSVRAIFLTAFAHFMSLCHILIILKIFQIFSLLSYLLW